MLARWLGTLLALLAATPVGALATEFVFPEGTRVTILTSEGGEFLGHGEVASGVLALPALPREVSAVIVFISRGRDQLEILRGAVRGGLLVVTLPGRGPVDFGELVIKAGVAVTLRPVGGGPPAGLPPAVGSGGPPGGTPPGPPGPP